MKTKSNRRKKRGIKALFCFLLAAELTLGSLSTPAQAEASEITTPEAKTETESSEITEPETKAEEAADTTPPPEKTEEEPEADEQKGDEAEPDKQEPETTEPEITNPPITDNTCICDSLCDIDSVNSNCPVCAGDYTKCTYEAEEELPAEEPTTKEPPIEDPPKQCICTTLCTKDSIDTGCPVCVEDSSLCTGEPAPQEEAPVTVTEEAPQMALLSDSEEEPQSRAEEEPFKDTTEGAPPLYYGVVNDGAEVVYNDTYLSLTGSLTIPKKVSDGTDEYTVTSIDGAFRDCTGLQTITIPDSVIIIDFEAFSGCTNLENITIPNSVTKIGIFAFMGCSGLGTITIPDSVTQIDSAAFKNCTGLQTITIPDSVATIGYEAFMGCTSLTSVTLPNQISVINGSTFHDCTSLSKITIPARVSKIGSSAFNNCQSLSRITIPSAVESIDSQAFENCTSLISLSIAVKQDSPITPVTVNYHAFENCPDPRYLTFVTEDGTELDESSELFQKAKAAYDNDHIAGDGEWYGWTIGKATEPPAPATYTVAIQVNLDDNPWRDHGKTFALSKDGGNTYITDFTAVADGTYSIYEITETAARAVSYLDTGVTVTVNGGNADAVIDYYTATFYDGMIPYESATAQHPQIVLKNTGVVQPLPPSKNGHSFNGWKTENNGSIDFDFANTKLTAPTSIYASWTAEVKPTHTIRASAGEGGSISPEGDIEVTEGTNYTFTIRADTGYQIKAVIVDGTDCGARTSYTFTNISGTHAIEAVFEKTETGGGGDEPEPDNPGGGGGSGSNGGSSGSGGSSSNGGGSGTGSSGDSNSGGGGSTESTNLSTGSSLPEAGAPAKAADTVSNANVNAPRPGEPKTGDASHLEVYASIAMIAGFVYLILYLMDGMKGMSEEEKNRRIAALLGWAKRGRAKTLRRYIAITAVFFVLAYYHAFGKQAALGWQKA